MKICTKYNIGDFVFIEGQHCTITDITATVHGKPGNITVIYMGEQWDKITLPDGRKQTRQSFFTGVEENVHFCPMPPSYFEDEDEQK